MPLGQKTDKVCLEIETVLVSGTRGFGAQVEHGAVEAELWSRGSHDVTPIAAAARLIRAHKLGHARPR